MTQPAAETAERPKLTAAQWDQVRRLISEFDQRHNAAAPEECQRAADRTAVEIPVRVTVDSDRSGPKKGGWAVARNISCGGLSVMTRRMIHPGTLVTVELPTPTGPPRRLIARVVRCRYVSELYHEIGVSFIDDAH